MFLICCTPLTILRCLIRLFYQVSDYQWASLVAQLVKSPFANAGGVGSIPGSGRFPGEGNGNPLKYSCLGNPIGRGALRATVCEITRVRYHLVTKQQHGGGNLWPGIQDFSLLNT